MAFIRKRVILFIVLLLASCANSSSQQHEIVAEQNIDKITKETFDSYKVYSRHGVGSLRLKISENSALTLKLFYADSHAYKQLEGIKIVQDSNGIDISNALLISNDIILKKDGRLLIKKAPLLRDWHIQFVDHYRH